MHYLPLCYDVGTYLHEFIMAYHIKIQNNIGYLKNIPVPFVLIISLWVEFLVIMNFRNKGFSQSQKPAKPSALFSEIKLRSTFTP